MNSLLVWCCPVDSRHGSTWHTKYSSKRFKKNHSPQYRRAEMAARLCAEVLLQQTMETRDDCSNSCAVCDALNELDLPLLWLIYVREVLQGSLKGNGLCGCTPCFLHLDAP